MTISKRTTMFLGYFLLLMFLLILAGWYIIAPKFDYHPPSTTAASALKPRAPLSGFSLIDTNGTSFTEKSLRGHWTLLFFGYTLCPDICPKTLSIVRDGWNMFTEYKQAIPVRFVFADISRQPVATTELKQFLQNYRPEFIGVSGTPEQMHQLSDQLGIYANQQQNKIDHTAALMLIDPQGRLHAVFTPPFTAEDLVQDLQVLTG